MTFGLLGPLELRLGGVPVDLGGPKQRAVLALLVLNDNRPVSSERLIDKLWDDPPATAQKSLQVYVSRLRRTLSHLSDRLETTPAGYVLRTLPDEVDLQRFEKLSAEGRAAAPGDPVSAATAFRTALALWRGPALADLASEPIGRLVAPGIEERRSLVLEDRIEVELALGEHAALAAELSDLVGRYPFRERLWAQLMLSLYRSGRQAEALEAFRRAGALLRDQLGIEPGSQLQRLHASILRQDPALDAPAPLPSRPRPDPGDRPPKEVPAGANPRRRRVLVAAVAVTAAVAAAAAAVLPGRFAHRSGGTHVRIRANSVAVVDPSTDVVVADIPVGTRPGPIVVAGASAWIGNVGDRTVERLDVRARTVVKTFGLSADPISLTAGDGVVWIGNGFDGTLSRILTAYDQLSAPFFPGPSLEGLLAVAASPGDLWVGLASGSVLRLDPASLREKSRFDVPGRPKSIAVGGGGVWTIQFHDRDVRRVDPGTGRITGMVQLPDEPQVLAVAGNSVWVATSGDDRLWRIDAQTAALAGSLPLGVSASAVIAQAGAVWVLDGGGGLLERIDPTTQTLVRTVRLTRPVGGMVFVGDRLWLTVD